MSRRAAVLALTLFASVLSCGREITGPGGRGALAQLSFAPDYSSMIDEVDGVMHSVSDLVPFTKVRIELRRLDNTVAATQIVDFPASETEIPLAISVRLSEAATRDGEILTAFLRYINAAGDTVFAGGPLNVTAMPGTSGSQQPPVQIPIAPTVPGAVFARIDIAPDTIVDTTGKARAFTAVGYDGQDNVVANAIIGFISRNPALVAVPALGSGNVNLVGVRGSTWIVAQSLTGVKDSAFVSVLPKPTQLVKVSGDLQTGLEGEDFAQPLRVRVLAGDGLGVADWPVQFAVTTGGGAVSVAVVNSDINGFAEVTWTAGTTLGAASVTASTTSPALSAVFNGTQVSVLPTSLAFLTQPSNITAGVSLPNLQVAVRNGAGTTMSEFTGPVTVSITGGTAGAALVGTTTVNAVAGVATFSGLTVNKGGAAYRVAATYAALPPAQSNTFDVAAAPPTAINLLGGAGQAAPPSTLLGDSIRVRLVDQFGFPIAGQTLQFTVAQGGGTLSHASRVTDGDGRASVTWTLGATGTQQVRVSLGGLETFVTASIVAGGSVQLAAGYDYTIARVGFTKAIPIFLTNPSPTPIEVTLEIDAAGSSFLEWTAPSITINPGVTRVDGLVSGLDLGVAWAIMRSAVGDDSVLVTVDSSFLALSDLNNYYHLEGDTIRTFVMLSEPAPAGGTTVILRSVNPTFAVLAPSSGRGVPAEGCIGPLCYGGGSIASVSETPVAAAGTRARLLATPADSAAVFIPEGQLFGEFAIILLDDNGGCAYVEISAESQSFAGATMSLNVYSQGIYTYIGGAEDPANGVGVGHQASVEFYSQVSRAREQRVYMESSDTLRVRVDSFVTIPPRESYAPRTTIKVIGLDTAWVRYWTDLTPMDSLMVVGSTPIIRINGGTAPEGGAQEISVSVVSELNPFNPFPPINDLTITLISGDPGVALPEQPTIRLRAGDFYQEANIRGIALGATFLAAEAPGYMPDTIFYDTYTPGVQFSNYSPTMGVQQLYDHFFFIAANAVNGNARSITVQSLTPAVVEVVTETVTLSTGTGSNGIVRLRGVSPGAALVRFSGPGISTTDLSITVVPTTLQLFASGTYQPDGIARSVSSVLGALGSARPLADTAYAVLRSSDPAVMEVSDSTIVFPALVASYAYTGLVRPLTPGNATIWLVRPGVDSVSVPVTVTPYEIRPVLSYSSIGQQLAQGFTIYRDGPDTLEAPITITHAGPGRVSFTTPTTFEVGQYSINVTMVGDSIGDDTLTFSVPGYPDVTRVVSVASTKANFTLQGTGAHAGSVYPYAQNLFSSIGSPSFPTTGRPMKLRVISIDTTVAAVVQDTVEWADGQTYEPSRYASVRFKKAGYALFLMEDLDGVLGSDTVQIFVQPGDLYGNSYYGSGEAVSLGMNQRTTDYEMYIQRGMVSAEPLWVHLESSDTNVVQVTDSVLIAPDDFQAYYNLYAGDSTGSARITATAAGYNPWVVDVLVTRTRFEMYTSEAYLDGKSWIELYSVDAFTRATRPQRVDLDAVLSTSTPSLLDMTGITPITIPADSSYITIRGPQGLAPGQGILRVTDGGPTRFDSVAAGTEIIDVIAPSVFSNVRRMRVSPKLITPTSNIYINVNSARDTNYVELASLTGRFAPLQDTIVVVSTGGFQTSAYYSARGISLGRDTLTFTMSGAATDTVIVDVDLGILATESNVGQTIVVGDSAYISLRVLDASGTPAEAAENITFNTSVSDGSLVFLEAGSPVSTVMLPTGEYYLRFWVRAESAGTATLTLTNSNFRTFSFRLNSVVRP